MFPSIPSIPPDHGAPLPVSPTEITQYTRLDHCERYLRLRLHERGGGRRFLEDYGVSRQVIPPILTRSGRRFEDAVGADIRRTLPFFDFSEQREDREGEQHDNIPLTTLMTDLVPGAIAVVAQVRIEANLGGWAVRGDADLIRLERTAAGALRVLVADIKSSAATKVEHRLQVAFYHEMVVTILADAGIAHEPIELAILYRGPAIDDGTTDGVSPGERERREAQRRDAFATFATTIALLERIADPGAYLDSVDDLVLGEQSTARRVLATPFPAIPFHIAPKCDDCPYNEFCMKRSAETDDLSLLPHLTHQEKEALLAADVTNVRQLAALKELRPKGTVTVDGEVREHTELVPAAGQAALTRRLATTWPVGPQLDTLIHRAKRHGRYTSDDDRGLTYIPNTGYGSLPYSDATQNPNLVRVFIDVQHDFLHDRLALAAALVVANERGEPNPRRRRTVVRLASEPPETAGIERALLVDWVQATISAIADVAAPNAKGEPKAPIHLFFTSPSMQKALLGALGRHATSVFGATALYDFVTQVAAYDSPVVTVLDGQIRERRTYPMTCQSLQSVAAFLGFDWNATVPYRSIFNARLFDYPARRQDPASGERTGEWYTRRSRFNSQVPLEYTYSAWNDLPDPPPRGNDPFGDFRHVDTDLLTGFFARRLEAMEHIAADLGANKQTVQAEFDLPDLARFEGKAATFAAALKEFVTIERHVELGAWKSGRLPAPEQRVLQGETLIVRYVEDDQAEGIAGRNRDNEHRRALHDQMKAAFAEANPGATFRRNKAQMEETGWSQDDMVFRLRLETAGIPCDLDEVLALSTLKPGDWLVMMPRLTTSSADPAKPLPPYTPTVRQLLYGMRVQLERLVVNRDADGRSIDAFAEVRPKQGGRTDASGFQFGSFSSPLAPGETYTLDPDPNSVTCSRQYAVACGLIDGGVNILHQRMAGLDAPDPQWPQAAANAQRRFLAGLDALHAVGAPGAVDFEVSKRAFIADHGGTPLLLVQGPPGTGKSFTTGFAVFARLQGAMAAGMPFRIGLSCRTHAAVDVLLEKVHDVQVQLRVWSLSHPDLFAECFDRRLLDISLFRLQPQDDVRDGIVAVPADTGKAKGDPRMFDRLTASPWGIAGATPNAWYRMIADKFKAKDVFGQTALDCLILDEASQMNIPEAMMAALPLAPDGRIVVVGDHRQMPPIVKNDWANETRRSFQEFRTWESLFLALRDLDPPMIQFERSFRLHADMAEFLRQEIYRHDGINYHSTSLAVLEPREISDPYTAAVLSSNHPLVVVVHDEARSQMRNVFEQDLMTPVLETLAAADGYALDAEEGLGVVVPHRAQRAALRDAIPALSVIHPETGTITASAVDTVERFQGDERTVIFYGATESDRAYLQAASKFLMEPRRLTVALSRAKRKLVLVAARSVFEVFSADEETFANAQLWKNLLRRTCTVPLWFGERDGHMVEVWGNPSTNEPPAEVS